MLVQPQFQQQPKIASSRWIHGAQSVGSSVQSCPRRAVAPLCAASHHRGPSRGLSPSAPGSSLSGGLTSPSRSTGTSSARAISSHASSPSGQRTSSGAATKGGQHGPSSRSMQQHGTPTAGSSRRTPNTPGVAASARLPEVLPPLGNSGSSGRERAQGKSQAGTAPGSSSAGQTHATSTAYMEPISQLDVDKDLWQVLDLCSESELEAVYAVLHGPSPFSPLVKSLVGEKEPALVELRGRLSLMHKIESRFRFLAADPAALLRGGRPTYRETLAAIRDRLDVPCSANLSTYDLETEVFLHVLKHCVEYVRSEHEVVDADEAAAAAFAHEGDGMSAPPSGRPKGGATNWVERVTAPVLFGLKELVPTLVKFGSAVTVSAVGRSTAQQLGAQLVASHIKYQAALRACGAAASGTWSKAALLEVAQHGLTTATARYSAVRGALSFIGPVMWGWLAADLALKAIGTDYARVIRAVFILAQVRLVRTQGFVNAGTAGHSPHGPGGGNSHGPGGNSQGGGGSSSGGQYNAHGSTQPAYGIATAAAAAAAATAAGATASRASSPSGVRTAAAATATGSGTSQAGAVQRYRSVQPVVPLTYDVMATDVSDVTGPPSRSSDEISHDGVRSREGGRSGGRSVTEIEGLSEEDEVRLDEDDEDDPYRNPDHIIN